jgi:hypothetical protein
MYAYALFLKLISVARGILSLAKTAAQRQTTVTLHEIVVMF